MTHRVPGFLRGRSSLSRPGLARRSSVVAGGLFLAVAALAAPEQTAWEPVGLSGGGGMFTPAISPADPQQLELGVV